jgi:cell division protein ZapA
MSEERKPIKVQILGEEYTLKGDADPQYVRKLAKYVDEKMRTTSKQTKLPSLGKIAMLVSLDIADELHQERQKNEHLLSQVKEKNLELVEVLKKQLQR